MAELYLVVGKTYTFNLVNRFFSETIPIITTSSSGGSRTGEVTSGVTNTWQTESGKTYTGAVTYTGSTSTLKAYTNDGSLSPIRTQLQKLKIEFTPTATGTFYLADAKNNKVSTKKLVVYADYGDVVNAEEVYHTLLLRQTNRTYSFNHNSDFLDSFLNSYVPGGVFARIKNLPPNISGFNNDKTFYDPADTATMQALIYEPEDDIMTHQWSHISPKVSISGLDLRSSFVSGSTEETSVAQLPSELPVEQLHRFKIATQDSDNRSVGYDDIPIYAISGTLMFTQWGVDSFMLGDNNLPYSYYPAGTWVPTAVDIGEIALAYAHAGSSILELADAELDQIYQEEITDTTNEYFAVDRTNSRVYLHIGSYLRCKSGTTGGTTASSYETVAEQKPLFVDSSGYVWTIDATANNVIRKWSSDLTSRTDYTLASGDPFNGKVRFAALTHDENFMYVIGGDNASDAGVIAKYSVSQLNGGDYIWQRTEEALTAVNKAVGGLYMILVDENDDIYTGGEYNTGADTGPAIIKYNGVDGSYTWGTGSGDHYVEGGRVFAYSEETGCLYAPHGHATDSDKYQRYYQIDASDGSVLAKTAKVDARTYCCAVYNSTTLFCGVDDA